MFRPKTILIGSFTLILLIFVSLSFITSEQKHSRNTIIFTAIPLGVDQVGFNKFPEGAKLLSINPEQPAPLHLSKEFVSARSPEISFDGTNLLFSAKKSKEDKWQIWEMNLRTNSTHQITNRSFNCTDPAYLPDGQIVFSSRTKLLGNIKDVMVLFTIETDGSNEKQITFHPNNDQNSTILQDGRILVNTYQVYPQTGLPQQLILRPDGAKAELFYKPRDTGKLLSRGWETKDGRFVYVEQSDKGSRRLMSVDQNRPLHSEINLSAGLNGEYYSIFPIETNQYLVSMEQEPGSNLGLYQLTTTNKPSLELVYSSNDYHLLEPVTVMVRPTPKILPSRIEEGTQNGTILCLDTDLSQDSISSTLQFTKTYSVEVLGIDHSFGKVPVSGDGSFYIEVPSNQPLRFQSFNEDGQLIRGPSDWIWVRPNERRGCIGCHEDKELVPENRVPMAVKKKPVNLVDHIIESNTE